MDTEINFSALTVALEYFKNKGYIYQEVPWLIPMSDIMITCPKDKYAMEVEEMAPNNGLIGSAEQGFLHLDRIKKLGVGKFVALSPCFRNEVVLDQWHQSYFMKVELYDNRFENPEKELENIIEDARYFFDYYNPLSSVLDPYVKLRETNVVTTYDGYDIEHFGIELGSYGVRQHDSLNWVYGTGIAEPRFSSVLKEFEA